MAVTSPHAHRHSQRYEAPPDHVTPTRCTARRPPQGAPQGHRRLAHHANLIFLPSHLPEADPPPVTPAAAARGSVA
ncbi:hypothetical protein E2C01_021811 [Portunus trituberculatus]|uniref:Uncharacterized protein n=1 Tax=Portunus trituberculatus TaxID=210409 RepID=A0A5B7E775_PORTR|nr:hypothetical protein [Portunus trituberculatus]